jgi:hypothetical protein
LLGRLLEAETFVKIDLKTPKVIDIGAALGRSLPHAQRMGHAFVDVLALNRPELYVWEDAELFTIADVDRARSAFRDPDMPFQLSCHGVTEENLTIELADELARRIAGRAEIINLNLPGARNPSADIVRHMWKAHGMLTEIRVRSPEEKAFWDGAGVPYFGTTDDPALASRIDVFAPAASRAREDVHVA